MVDKEKVLKKYIENSTPQEMFFELYNRQQEIQRIIDSDTIFTDVMSRFPTPKDGRDGKDGVSPDPNVIVGMVLDRVVLPKDGKDGINGSPDTPEEIRDKIASLTGKARLSIFDLKDTEWLAKAKNIWVQGNIVGSTGGISTVTTDATLTGNGSTTSPLGIALNHANTWSAIQTFGNNISFGGATLNVSGLTSGDVLRYNGTNWVNTAVGSLGVTLANVSSASTNTAKSLYTMTSTVPVEFQTSGGGHLLYLDETNARVGVGTNSPSSAFTIADNSGLEIKYAGSLQVVKTTKGSVGSYNVGFFIENRWDATWTPFVVKAAASQTADIFGILNSSNSILFNVTASGAVGIGTSGTVSARLHVISTTEQFRSGYDASNWVSETVGSKGIVTRLATGSAAQHRFNDSVSGVPLYINGNLDGNYAFARFSTPSKSGGYRGGFDFWSTTNNGTPARAFTMVTDNATFTTRNPIFFVGPWTTTNMQNYIGTFNPTIGTLSSQTSGNRYSLTGTVSTDLAYNLDEGNYFALGGIASGNSIEGSFWGTQFAPVGAGYSMDAVIQTTNEDRTITHKMRIKGTSGNVGIGMGTSRTVSAKLHVIGTTEQFRVGYDTSNYWKNTVDSSGNLTLDLVAGSGTPAFTFGKSIALGTNSITMTGSIAATGARVTKGWFTDIESTNIPTVGGTAILTSLTAPSFSTSVTTPQVFNADNNITASGNAATVTRANRNNVVTNNSAATLTVTLSTTGATAGDWIIVQILDFSAVAQTITWVNTENSTISAPTTSNGSTTLPLSVTFKWNPQTSKWRCLGYA